ncbi:hypothetical protein SAMN02799630_03673 [Paenibacillus sp. UNCCL117]|uniref:transmembrane-type terpene cyclase n=1 Tax=unclassified Paenibacillus TaxID=185978 RepID=UPI00087FB941|nr:MULTISPECIES: hypothetical protein [unclassified Paenibacillus]SDD51312.1 hypothetical protein SAMN04488602_109124 [Paenibacillus sp. cl123]SFW49544.1 hypothetical protein SAMN02799630_03673 [Paenibacillus sp. UNCCL117]
MMEHLLPVQIERLLQYGIGLFWTLTYILIIYKGYRDRTCGMPFFALCANISWEFLFTYLFSFGSLQFIVVLVWFVLDCIILFQFILYSKGDSTVSGRLYRMMLLPSIAFFFVLHIATAFEFNDDVGKYSAFGINLMMSLLFVRMFIKQGTDGQSIWIAYFKMVGTLSASILSYSLYPTSVLLAVLSISTFLLDVIYILLLKTYTVNVIHKKKSGLLSK